MQRKSCHPTAQARKKLCQPCLFYIQYVTNKRGWLGHAKVKHIATENNCVICGLGPLSGMCHTDFQEFGSQEHTGHSGLHEKRPKNRGEEQYHRKVLLSPQFPGTHIENV